MQYVGVESLHSSRGRSIDSFLEFLREVTPVRMWCLEAVQWVDFVDGMHTGSSEEREPVSEKNVCQFSAKLIDLRVTLDI